ncbi:MAG: DNA recombination protein RmuC [Halopseudomonas sp.]
MAALVIDWFEQLPSLMLLGFFIAALLLGWVLGYLPQRGRYLAASSQWSQQQNSLDTQLSDAITKVETLQQANTQLQVDLSGSRERAQGLLRLESQLSERDELIQRLQIDKGTLKTEVREMQVRFEAEQRHHAEKLALLEQSSERMQQQFTLLAQQIFDDNSRKFGTQQQQKMQDMLQPLREQLGDFRRRVDDVYDKESKDRRGLAEQVAQLKQLNLQMSEDAINLTQALKGENKTQGNWGELILERVLEESGLRSGYEYEIQFSAEDESGRRLQPDVVIHLPEQKDIIVDAKVSLVAYERYCSSNDEAEQQQALTEHIGSIKRHVKGLSNKSYESLPSVHSLDFVLLFIPIEAAFLTAIEQDRQLFGDAFERNILLVSPSTLLVTLRTINNIWRYEKQSVNAQEIAKRGGELHDKFVGFVAALEDVGKHINQSQRAYETAMGRLSSGKGNLVNRAAALKQLGVRAKKELSTAIVDRAEAGLLETQAADSESADS